MQNQSSSYEEQYPTINRYKGLPIPTAALRENKSYSNIVVDQNHQGRNTQTAKISNQTDEDFTIKNITKTENFFNNLKDVLIKVLERNKVSIEPALIGNVKEEVFDETLDLKSERPNEIRKREPSMSENENEDGVSSSDSEPVPMEMGTQPKMKSNKTQSSSQQTQTLRNNKQIQSA